MHVNEHGDDERATPSYVMDVISDMVSDFLYYNRKEDDILERGMIEDMVKRGDLTIEQMVSEFEKLLRKAIK